MAIAHVQTAGKVVTGVNNTTLAYTSSVTAGSLLCNAHAHWISGADVAITVPTDTRGNTYNGINAEQNGGSFNSLRAFYSENTSAGACTVTFDLDGAGTGDLTVSVSEFSGVATSASLDKVNTSTGTGTTASAGASGTLTQADEVIYAAMMHTGNNTAITQDTADGFSLGYENEGGTNDMPIATQYKIVSATTDTTPNWTLGASRTWFGQLGTFKAAGGGEPAAGPKLILRMLRGVGV